MNHEITPTFGEQTDMLELLVWLSMERPGLPVPSLSLSNYSEPAAHLTVDVAEFEPWREAFGLDAAAVELRLSHSRGESYLRVEGTYTRSLGGREVSIHVEVAGWSLPQLTARDAERPVVEYSDGLTEAFAGITPAVTA